MIDQLKIQNFGSLTLYSLLWGVVFMILVFFLGRYSAPLPNKTIVCKSEIEKVASTYTEIENLNDDLKFVRQQLFEVQKDRLRKESELIAIEEERCSENTAKTISRLRESFEKTSCVVCRFKKSKKKRGQK